MDGPCCQPALRLICNPEWDAVRRMAGHASAMLDAIELAAPEIHARLARPIETEQEVRELEVLSAALEGLTLAASRDVTLAHDASPRLRLAELAGVAVRDDNSEDHRFIVERIRSPTGFGAAPRDRERADLDDVVTAVLEGGAVIVPGGWHLTAEQREELTRALLKDVQSGETLRLAGMNGEAWMITRL